MPRSVSSAVPLIASYELSSSLSSLLITEPGATLVLGIVKYFLVEDALAYAIDAKIR